MIAPHSNGSQKLRVSFPVLISSDQGTSELFPEVLLRSLVQGNGVGVRLLKRHIQCLIEHHQCVWIIGFTGPWHSSHPTK
jgi:hypothetical protein